MPTIIIAKAHESMEKQEWTKEDRKATVQKHSRFTGYLATIYGYNEYKKAFKVIQHRHIKGLEKAVKLAKRWIDDKKYLDQK